MDLCCVVLCVLLCLLGEKSYRGFYVCISVTLELVNSWNRLSLYLEFFPCVLLQTPVGKRGHVLQYLVSASVRKVDGKWVFSDGIDKSAVAYGTISVAINETGKPGFWLWKLGWNILKVSSNQDFSNEDQSYAAGLIEGYLSEDMIYTHSKNIYTEKQPSEFVI